MVGLASDTAMVTATNIFGGAQRIVTHTVSGDVRAALAEFSMAPVSAMLAEFTNLIPQSVEMRKAFLLRARAQWAERSKIKSFDAAAAYNSAWWSEATASSKPFVAFVSYLGKFFQGQPLEGIGFLWPYARDIGAAVATSLVTACAWSYRTWKLAQEEDARLAAQERQQRMDDERRAMQGATKLTTMTTQVGHAADRKTVASRMVPNAVTNTEDTVVPRLFASDVKKLIPAYDCWIFRFCEDAARSIPTILMHDTAFRFARHAATDAARVGVSRMPFAPLSLAMQVLCTAAIAHTEWSVVLRSRKYALSKLSPAEVRKRDPIGPRLREILSGAALLAGNHVMDSYSLGIHVDVFRGVLGGVTAMADGFIKIFGPRLRPPRKYPNLPLGIPIAPAPGELAGMSSNDKITAAQKFISDARNGGLEALKAEFPTNGQPAFNFVAFMRLMDGFLKGIATVVRECIHDAGTMGSDYSAVEIALLDDLDSLSAEIAHAVLVWLTQTPFAKRIEKGKPVIMMPSNLIAGNEMAVTLGEERADIVRDALATTPLVYGTPWSLICLRQFDVWRKIDGESARDHIATQKAFVELVLFNADRWKADADAAIASVHAYGQQINASVTGLTDDQRKLFPPAVSDADERRRFALDYSQAASGEGGVYARTACYALRVALTVAETGFTPPLILKEGSWISEFVERESVFVEAVRATR
jgi:hypothetical protein